MAAQRLANRARANKPAASKASKAERRTADSAVAEADDSETLTDRAYRLVEELIVTLALPPETILSEQSLAARSAIGLVICCTKYALKLSTPLNPLMIFP